MAEKNQILYDFWQKFLDDSGCFESLKRDSKSAVLEVFSGGHSILSLFTDEAKLCMEKNYAERMKKLYFNSLVTEFQEALKNYDTEEEITLAGNNLEALNNAAEDVRKLTNNYSSEYFRKKYSPVFGEYEDNIRRNFINSMKEFIDNLSESINLISSELFDGQIISKITGLSSDSADVHRHGRMVLCVKTDIGNFYYKPHDCGLDSFYYELISNYFSENTCAAKVVEGNGYVFVSEIVRSELERPEDVGKYYYNFGVLTAIFHGLGSTDMHQENIIACGVKPSAADIETLVTAKLANPNKRNIKSYVDYALSLSVRRTLVFPARIHKGPMISALHCMDDNLQSTPKCNGEKFNIAGHEEEFISGFKEGYSRMIKFREEIKHMFSKRKNIVVRYVMRNTMYYFYMISYLFKAEAMTSLEAREKVLSKLNAPYEVFREKLARENAVSYERACVIQGDIPYYCLHSSGHDLCGEDTREIIQYNYFDVSPEEMLNEKLDSLSEKEYKFEEDTIRCTLTCVPYDSDEYDEKIPLSSEVASINTLRGITAHIFKNLHRSIIHVPNGLFTWTSIASSMCAMKSPLVYVQRIEAGLYSAKILSIPEFTQLHAQANDILQNSIEATRRYIDQWERIKDTSKSLGSLGLYIGLGGFLMALGKLADLGIHDVTGLINRTLTLINDLKPYHDQEPGIVYGISGLMIAVAELKRNGYADYRISDKILNDCAIYLSECNTESEATGSKGLDGIGAAFAEAYSCTGNESFAEQAIKQFKNVRENYAEYLAGWP